MQTDSEGCCPPYPIYIFPVLPPAPHPPTPGACGKDLKTQAEGQRGHFPKAESRIPRKPLLLSYPGPSYITSLELITPSRPWELLQRKADISHLSFLTWSVPSRPTHLTNWGFAAGAQPSLCQLFLTYCMHKMFSLESVLSVRNSLFPSSSCLRHCSLFTPFLRLRRHTILFCSD